MTDLNRERIAVRDQLRWMLPDSVSIAVWGIDTMDAALRAEEREAIRRAVPKRVREFARGRATARCALAQLGVGPRPIPIGDHRQPIWPKGVVGAITHAGDLVAAAVARSSDCSCLGIDVEHGVELPSGITEMILTRAEQADPVPVHGLVRFSAKESIHKAIFPSTGVWLEPLDVCVTLTASKFQAGPVHERIDAAAADEVLACLEGSWASELGSVVSVAWVDDQV